MKGVIVMYSKAQNEASKKYRQKAIKQINFQLNRETDASVIEWMDKQGNKNDYLRSLVLADMAKHQST
jgi:hypothetical protein